MDVDSRDQFAADALAVAARVLGPGNASYSAGDFALLIQNLDGQEGRIYLSNAFAQTREVSVEQRLAVLERLVSAAMPASSSLKSWTWVKPRLRTILRPTIQGIGQPDIEPPLSEPALPHLREVVVVDTPDSMAYVAPSLLDQWGVTAEEVFGAARSNLADLAQQMLVEVTRLTSVARMTDPGDRYLTSLLLVPGWLASVAGHAGGPVVAFAPDAYTLILAKVDAASMPAVYQMVEAQYAASPRALSPVGYIAVDDAVMPYALDAGTPEADHVAATRAAALLTQNEYIAQQQWFAESNGQEPDGYLASVTVIAQPDKPAFTVAVWSDGVDTLLPAAQYVLFMDGDDNWLVPRKTLEDRLGWSAEPNMDPPRFRTCHWPDREVLDELFKHAWKL